MTTYKLYQHQGGGIKVDNTSPMYPVEFEEYINRIAGKKITEQDMENSFMGCIHNFYIPAEHRDFFTKEILQKIGKKKDGDGGVLIYNPEEDYSANLI